VLRTESLVLEGGTGLSLLPPFLDTPKPTVASDADTNFLEKLAIRGCKRPGARVLFALSGKEVMHKLSS
jgi:hypothetical protein